MYKVPRLMSFVHHELTQITKEWDPDPVHKVTDVRFNVELFVHAS